MTLEIEMKFSLAPDGAEKLLAFCQSLGVVERRRHLVTTYYDSYQHLLRKAGIVLRVRADGDRREQTIKIPGPGPLGMQVSTEVTVPLPGEVPDVALFEPAFGAQGIPSRLRRKLHLLPQFVTEIERAALDIEYQGARFELALDVGWLRAGQRSQRICEAEFELKDGNVAGMLDYAMRCVENQEMRLVHRTKSARGYALVRPSLVPGPTRAGRIKLKPGMSVGEAFRCVVGETMRHLHANEEPCRAGHAEGVHQARVAMRRMRAALWAFRHGLPKAPRKAFDQAFHECFQQLGPARDWQVFLSETLPAISRDQPDRLDVIQRLRRIATAERRAATMGAVEMIESKRYSLLMLQFQHWLLELEGDDRPPFDGEVKPFAAHVLSKVHARLFQDTRPLARMPVEDLHGVRKRGKKARYAGEFFARLWSAKRVAPYLSSLEKLQDQLGAINDAAIAVRNLAALAPATVDDECLMLVQNWSEARVSRCLKRAQGFWKRAQKRKAYW
ncbi:MAG: CYTH and CHAD domain-containing protein [Proteobacteria bacterium]|nr:CYTH and CHAD domain-containing protein [Pseudomonadota bacterium]MDA1298922.1 CYTH and CHAD domain-containing protein [Pseudomonadota bacterium]